MLALNGITPGGATTLLDLDGDDAAGALLVGKVDAVFLMGDNTSPKVMRQLEHENGIQMFDFTQADGYARRITYVNKLVLPEGSIDFGKNISAHDVNLIGPTRWELIARPKLHPALFGNVDRGGARNERRARALQASQRISRPIQHDFPSAPTPSATSHRGKDSSTPTCLSGWPAW